MTTYHEDIKTVLKDIRNSVEMLKHFGVRFVAGRLGRTPADTFKEASVYRADGQHPPDNPGKKNEQTGFFQAPRENRTPLVPPKDGWQPNALTLEQAQAKLDGIRKEMGACVQCTLHAERSNIVFGEGNPKTQLVLVGEGPGREEDRTGRPFVGRAGQLLDRILAAMGTRREEVYICNVVKCRPPNNRVPQDEEMRTCGMFLTKQLEVIQPRHVLALGSTAVKYLIGSNQPMSKLRGRFFEYRYGTKILPTYHPAYLLRNPAAKKLVWEDVQKIMSETCPTGPKSMESFGS